MTGTRKQTIKQALILIFMYGAFFLFLFSTDPHKLPVGLLLVPFVWLYAALFLTLYYAAKRRRPKEIRIVSKTIATISIIAAIPTFILLLDSINQLTLSDALLFVIFAVLALFYVRKVTFKRNI